MSLAYTVRPIRDRTWMRPAAARERSRFTASWSDTLGLLERELTHLRARQLVLEMDVTERDIRVDGQIRANARPSSDAVVVAFDSRHHRNGGAREKWDRLEEARQVLVRAGKIPA